MSKKLLCILALILALVFTLSSCQSSFSVSEDGYLIINGEETGYEVSLPEREDDEITVNKDGYLVVNGVETEYKIDTKSVVTVDKDGYIVVDGIKTEYKTEKQAIITVDKDGYVVVNGIKTEHNVNGNGNSENPHGLLFTLKSDGTYKVSIGAAKKQSRIEIPATYNGIPVTEVGSFGAENIIELSQLTFTNPYLKEIVIPEGITKLSAFCFAGCYDLRSVVIPDSVTEIGAGAFMNCLNLRSITIGEGVSKIGIGAFNLFLDQDNFCPMLVELVNKSSVDVHIYNAASSMPDGEEATYGELIELDVHDGESKIVNKDDYLFYTKEDTHYLIGYMGDNTDLVLPESYNGNSYEIAPLAFAYSNIDSVVISDGVTKIGYGAFGACPNLLSVTIGSNVESIGIEAFVQCINLVEIINKSQHISTESIDVEDTVTIHDGESKIKNIDGYIFNTAGESNILIRYRGNDTDLSLPETCEGENYEIGGNAFIKYDITPVFIDSPEMFISFDSMITSVIIPDSVTKIHDEAFESCILLSEVKIGNGVTSIGSSAFYDCSSLVSVTIPDSVTSIGDWAFSGCSSLLSVTIPGSVTSIGEYAFSGCSSLLSVTIPDSVTSIGEYAFSGCSSLVSVTIPDSVTSIGYRAFAGCSSLVSVVIGDGVTSIGNYAFAWCDSLVSVVIGDSVTSIGEYAFYNCYSLVSVVIGDSVTSISYCAFDDCDSLTDVYYTGTEEEWANIEIDNSYGSNKYLLNATIHYNYVPEK